MSGNAALYKINPRSGSRAAPWSGMTGEDGRKAAEQKIINPNQPIIRNGTKPGPGTKNIMKKLSPSGIKNEENPRK